MNHLPRGLAEIFDSRICRIQKQQEGYQAIKLLKYCGTAKRPLTIDEYKELLGLSTGDTFLDRKKMPNNIKRLVRGCFGLTFVDDEEYTIHYIHHSIKEHLFSPQSHEAARFDAGGIELELGLLCMTYLNLADFTGQLSRVSKSYVDPIVLGASTVTTSSSGKKLAQKLLRRRGESMGIRFDAFERTVLESAKEHGARNCFQFLAYANIHWLLHLRDLKPRDIESWSLFGKCIENRNLPLVRPWESQIEAAPKDPWFKFAADLSPYLRRDPSALMWCLNQKQYALFLYFTMNIALHGPPSEEVTTFPPFDDADDIHWIDMLISVPSFSLSWGSWLLNVMAVESLSNPTRLKHSFELLRKMAAVNPTEARLAFKKALNVAILKDEGLDLMLSVDELFYKEDAIFREDPRIYEKMHDYIEKYARFPTLVWASREGNLDMTLAVLAVGANINVQDDSGHTAIHMAAVHGHLNMLKELRAAGADMTLRNDAGELAIHVAADQGRKDIVGYLLSLGIDPNVAASSGETALQLAASKGHTQLLAFLMAVGANVNQVDRRSATALHKAANRSRSESADYLLSVGASVHMKDHLGETALHKAAKNGASILVKSLLAAGADPLAANNNGLTVLDLASLGGNMELVEIFQSGGAVACTGEVYGLSK